MSEKFDPLKKERGENFSQGLDYPLENEAGFGGLVSGKNPNLDAEIINADSQHINKKTLAREHLKEGTPHIIYNLIYSKLSQGFEVEERFKNEIEKIRKNGLYIDALNGHLWHDEAVRKIASHYISSIDERDKFSKGYMDCVGLVVVGKSKTTGKEISFMTHQSTDYGMSDEDLKSRLDAYWDKMDENSKKTYKIGEWEKKENANIDFDLALNENLKKILNDAEDGTVDAVIFGGSVFDTNQSEKYTKIIEKISQRLTSSLGFRPVVLTGPGGNLVPNIAPYTDVFFDTQKRQVYIVREPTPDKTRDNPRYASEQ